MVTFSDFAFSSPQSNLLPVTFSHSSCIDNDIDNDATDMIDVVQSSIGSGDETEDAGECYDCLILNTDDLVELNNILEVIAYMYCPPCDTV